MSTTPRFPRTSFHKSSYSNPHESCVEVASDGDAVEIRDSKTEFGSPVDAHLTVTGRQFAALLRIARSGGNA